MSTPVLCVPLSEQLFLAFDVGLKRTGVAVGNRLTRSGNALATIRAEGDARFPPIGDLIRQWQPQALVVGIPCYPDGNPHTMTARAERFMRQLQGRFALPVYPVDERYSSVEAIAQGADDIDAEAARIILEQFLRSIE